MTRVDEPRLDDVVFACAVTVKSPRSMAELHKALARYRRDDMAATDWQAHVAAAVARLQRDGRLDERRGPGPKAESSRSALGLAPNASWIATRDRLFPTMALGIAAPATISKAKNGLAAAIVARGLGLWSEGAPPTPSALANALVWHELNLRGKPKRVPAEIHAHFLRQKLREATGEGTSERWLRQLAAQLVGASSTTPDSLRNALVARWISTIAFEALSSSVAPPTRPADTDPSPRDFVDAVREVVHRTRDGRFGDRQVFIVSVWRNLRSDSAYADLTLEDFKRRLVEAHRSGQLELVRADLIGIMDPLLVAESEIRHLEARFHFLLEEAA
jgi:hypothetical protein